jgi:hypothetical protein
VQGGWNILSVPSVSPDSSVTTLFPGATSQAYTYNTTYIVATHVRPGKGYWLKFGAPDTFTVCGRPVQPMEVPVSAGWNIIGPYDADVTVAGITTTPAGIIGSLFYGYERGYAIAVKLVAGMGYWIKAMQPGMLNLESGTAKAAVEIAGVDPGWIRVALRDSAGHEGVLYLASGELEAWKADLPPVPPEGIFDVRFAGDRYVEGPGKQHRVVLQSVDYPLVIQATNLQGAKLSITNGDGGALDNGTLEEGKRVTIARPVRGLEIGVEGVVPTTFELSQNYPNPFNPKTVVSYQLPVASIVKLVVYDLLGREVSVLVNERREAGVHTITFDGSGLPSGVYFYRIQARDFVEARKLLLVR